jgi:SAM-dependent methyltransferase
LTAARALSIIPRMTDAYDRIAYPGSAFPDTHPDRLATIGQLLGMRTAAPDACRVLELGCGDGMNLLPLAWAFPHSTFVGIDRAAAPIERGRRRAEALGLRNLRLEQADILEIGPELGAFDYIVAQGVFSWVPEPVRQAVLRISRQNLAPQGIAFISYLALPGSHLRSVFRDMMRFHVRGIPDPEEQVRQARAVVQLIADAPSGNAHQEFARSLLDELQRADDGVIFHDLLAEINATFHFVQFIDLAMRAGLQFLSEAEYEAGFYHLGEEHASVVEALRRLEGDVLAREQYLDFLRCRRFRQTLLVHADVSLTRPVSPDRMDALHAAGAAVRRDEHTFEFSEGGRKGEMSVPGLAEARVLERLGAAWPGTIPVRELVRDGDASKRFLLLGYERGLIELWTLPSRCVPPSDRPTASPVARLQAAEGIYVATLKHRVVQLNDSLGRELITLLDGTRDRASLLDALGDRQMDAESLEEHLREIEGHALLCA